MTKRKSYFTICTLGLAIAALSACATSSQVAKAEHVEVKAAGETTATAAAQATEHATDKSTEQKAEHKVAQRTGGAVHIHRVKAPDGTVTTDLFRDPFESLITTDQHAATQNAVEVAKASAEQTAAAASTSSSTSSDKTEKEHKTAKPELPGFSCASGGGIFAGLLVAAAALFVWRRIRASKIAKAAAAVVEAVVPLS